jgi:hypothetical protein
MTIEMNAQNNKEVIRAISYFSAYLLASVSLAVCMYASFIKTSVIEVQQILEKSERYDLLQMKQIILTETADSVYYYAMLINSDDVHVNQSAMYNMLSMKSINFNENLEIMGNDDCLVYKKLFSEFGNFLQLKDSIRIANREVELLRDEYIRCMNKNKDMTRRLFTGSVY